MDIGEGVLGCVCAWWWVWWWCFEERWSTPYGDARGALDEPRVRIRLASSATANAARSVRQAHEGDVGTAGGSGRRRGKARRHASERDFDG